MRAGVGSHAASGAERRHRARTRPRNAIELFVSPLDAHRLPRHRLVLPDAAALIIGSSAPNNRPRLQRLLFEIVSFFAYSLF